MSEAAISADNKPITKRIEELNTKAYYLLVALSFIYGKGAVTASLQWAFTLTAAVAVMPVQDYASRPVLGVIRCLKIVGLAAALGFTLYWLWTTKIIVSSTGAGI